MNKGILIQARTGSTRLPGKMLKEFYGGKTLIEIIIERLISFNTGLPIILATTVNSKDTPLAEIAAKNGIKVYRGEEENVLSRFSKTTREYSLDAIIRVCADNPFIDKSFMNSVLENSGNSDYCSFFKDSSTPVIRTHYGFFTEYVTANALTEVLKADPDKFHLEHVTNYIYGHEKLFKIKKLDLPAYFLTLPSVRLTIDTAEDFDVCKVIYAYFCDKGQEMTAANVLEFLKERKDLVATMQEQILKNGK
ncbi:MAG: hypothetical protein M3R27_13865 [Bacteroidota bacterium]|nr:hypothetical protein [Bacteroidota bacterium]